jgi:hypothetical protein
MKHIAYIFLFIALSVSAQKEKEVKPTTSFTITGRVKAPVTISIADLKELKLHDIGDVVITNHSGEPRGTAKGLKGILLKDVLGMVSIDAENPRVLSEYYFVCKANDNYTVVYSWNELFNTVVGESAYIVLEKEGKPADQLEDSILMISSKDQKTGRRHVKALTSIEVKRA